MALDVHVAQLHLYLKRLIARIRNLNILVEMDKLFLASEAVSPSTIGKHDFASLSKLSSYHHGLSLLVLRVGRLFDIFYYLSCSPKERKRVQHNFDQDIPVAADIRAQMIKRYCLPFASFIATMALMRTNGKAQKPLFYMSLIDEYHGLSNRGVATRAAYKTGLSRRSYKTCKEEALRNSRVHIDDALSKGLAVGVADNYNKQYFVNKVDAKQRGLQNENRCVAALSLVPSSLELKAGNRDLQSMPHPSVLAAFIPAAMAAIGLALEQRRTRGSSLSEWRFYDGAEVTVHDVYCVPLKTPAQVVQQRGMPAHDIGLKNFRPLFVHSANPASNKGCFEMITDLYDEFYAPWHNNHYIPLRFDINIYNMFLRVRSQFFV